jgi:hypothetical protein
MNTPNALGIRTIVDSPEPTAAELNVWRHLNAARLPRCRGCGHRTADYMTTFTADGRRLELCRDNEPKCADRFRAAL